jgi:hypothetical protein
MKYIPRPTAVEFYKLQDTIGREVRVLETLRLGTSREEPGLKDVGLLGLFAGSVAANVKRDGSLPSLVGEVARIEAAIGGNKTYQWLRSQQAFQKLRASLSRKAKKSPDGNFARPVAIYRLIQCVSFGLGVQAAYLEGRRQPGQMTKKDWGDALLAIQTLRRLEREKGLKLARVFAAKAGTPPWDGALQFEERLIEAKRSAKKPHDDGFLSDRAAARAFTEWLLMMFGEAPPTMVESFADLIGYNKDSVRKQIKDWETSYRTDSLI